MNTPSIASQVSTLQREKDYAEEALKTLARTIGSEGLTWTRVVYDAVQKIERHRNKIAGMQSSHDEEVSNLRGHICKLADEYAGHEKSSAKMLGMATDLNLELQNKADMWRDELLRIRAIVYDGDLHTNSEIAGICDRAISDIRSNISLIDQREKACDMIAKLNEEATATEELLRAYGWKQDESLQMFLHRTRIPADPLKHSPEYLAALLQNCEDALAKATTALKAIFEITDPYADGAIDASAHDKLCNEVSSLARPWARTHSENVQAQIPRTQDVANATDSPERLSAAPCSTL